MARSGRTSVSRRVLLTEYTKGGLGSASFVLDNGVTVGALVAANPIGSVTTPGNRHFFAAPFEAGQEFGGLGPDTASGLGRDLTQTKLLGASERENTTIAIVATDARLTKFQCHRMAVAAEEMLDRKPEEVIRLAVKGMLPKGPLGYAQCRKLKVYAGAEHPHTAQQPQPLNI